MSLCAKPSSTVKFMKITTLNSLVVAGLLAVTTQIAFCQGTIYFVRSDFQAALNSSTTITFEDVSNPPGIPGLGAYSITASGVTFTTSDPLLLITGPAGPIPGDGKYLWHFDGSYPVDILLPSGVTAFGADFSGGIEPNPSFDATWTVNLVGGSSYAYNFSALRGSWTFFGVSFPEPIANLVYRDAGPPDGVMGGPLHEEMLDNVTFGAIPEPRGLELLALGVVALGWRRWLKKSLA